MAGQQVRGKVIYFKDVCWNFWNPNSRLALATKSCVLDGFAAGFLELYPQEAEQGLEAQTVLQTLSMCVDTDTVRIEEGHGRVHRL